MLKENEIAGPIRTPIGYHLIKLLDRTKDQIHTQHILSLIKMLFQFNQD